MFCVAVAVFELTYCCDIESMSMTLIQRRNNAVCPEGHGYHTVEPLPDAFSKQM